MTEAQLRSSTVETMRGWRGTRKGSDGHEAILEIYNSIRPLPRGYELQPSDNWCAGCVSAAFQLHGLTPIMVPECSCSAMVEGAKARGLWRGSRDYVPAPGDICLFDWGADKSARYHVGLVTARDNTQITTTEGNRTVNGVSQVADRTFPVGWACIWGYIVPDYAAAADQAPAQWYDAAMTEARDLGLMDGTRPLDTVTRAELATVATRLYHLIVSSLDT